MRLATPETFEDPAGWYWPPYDDFPYFQDRAVQIRGRWATGKVLVAGCGYGYTIQHLVGLGLDAWGCDASAYAVNRGRELLPANIRTRIVQGDVTSTQSMNAVRQAAGLPGNQRFVGVATEDLLPCLTDAEVATALPVLRNISQQGVVHIVTCTKPYDLPDTRFADMNWKSRDEWKAIVAPDLVIDTEDPGVVV